MVFDEWMKDLETEALNPCLESEKILFQLIQELDCLVPNFMVTLFQIL